MKRLIISIVALFVCMVTFGQNKEVIDNSSHTVIYDYKINTVDVEDTPVTDVCELAVQVGKNVTKCSPIIFYLGQKGEIKDFFNKEKGLPFVKAYADITRMHLPIVFTDYPKGKITTQEMIIPNLYIATDKYSKIKWKLSKETTTINGYFCYAATANYAGKKWNVWYTKDKGISAGPWKLQGLKGLIISATDEEGIHSFSMKDFMEEKMPIYYHSDEWERHVSTDSMKIVKSTSAEMIAFRDSIFGNEKYIKNPWYYDDKLYSYRQTWIYQYALPQESFYNVCGSYYYIEVDENLNMKHLGRKYQPLELK